MAYNNGFPINYPQMYYQNSNPSFSAPNLGQNAPNANLPNNSSIIWVNGEIGAKSYLVAPNTTVQLWDSEQQSIYLKSADASGMPTIRTLDYTFREQAPPKSPIENMANSDDYATKDDIKMLEGKIDGLQAKIESAVPVKTSSRKKANSDDDE